LVCAPAFSAEDSNFDSAVEQDQTQLPGVTTTSQVSQSDIGPGGYKLIVRDKNQVLRDLHKDDLKEIRAGEIALKYAVGSDVKTFANHLVRDHKAADDKILAYAKENGFDLGNDKEIRHDIESSHFIKKLKGLRGYNFDRYFSSELENDHAQAISMVESARADLGGQDFKDLLGHILPDLRIHHSMAAQLEKKYMGKD